MNTFEMQTVLTEQCNLNCTYCYMDKNPKVMSKETFDTHYESIQDILDFYDIEKFKISLFGGEPTMNWDLIEYIIKTTKDDPRLDMYILITNGLALNEERVKYLQENNVFISFSFDGLWSNENRPLMSTGQPSFNEYMSRKEFFQTFDSCKVMVSPDNISTLTENFEWFVDEFGFNFPDYSLVRDDIWSKENINDMKVEIRRLGDRVIKYFEDGITALPGFFNLYLIDSIIGKAKGKRPFTCFAGRHGLAFLPNGGVYPCARFGSADKYKIYDSNTKEFNYELANRLKSDEVKNPMTFKKCQACDLHDYCNSGCTYSQLKEIDGEIINEPLQSICTLFHIIYDEIFRITDELKDNKDFRKYIKFRLDQLEIKKL